MRDPFNWCVGLIYLYNIKMCRPGGSNINHRSCYYGHKRFQILNYKTLKTPDRLIFGLYGPMEGRNHYLTLLRQSRWYTELEIMVFVVYKLYYVCGDSTYNLRPYMQVLFYSVGFTAEKLGLNTEMSSVRVSVMWNYKDLNPMWLLTTMEDCRRLGKRLYRYFTLRVLCC